MAGTKSGTLRKSPFQTNRFEYENKHLYFLPEVFPAVLEPPKPVYLIGSRGTGKTTLLKALHWREQLQNESLKRQLKRDPFAERYIGVYLKLPEIQLNAFENALPHWQKERKQLFISLYLDTISLQLLIDAVAEMVALNYITAEPRQEQEYVAQVFEEISHRLAAPGHLTSDRGSLTLKALSKYLKTIQINMERFAIYGGSCPADGYVGQIGDLSRIISKMLGDICNASLPSSERPWHFKICMDEGEALTEDNQLIINTMVRLSKWPLFHIVCFVKSPGNLSRTLFPNLNLSDTDCKLVFLDQISDNEFRSLCEGVATVRSRELLQDYEIKFNSKTCLGKLNINRLIGMALEESSKERAKQLLKNAREKATECIVIENGGVSDDSEDRGVDEVNIISPPFYQTYLIEKLKLQVPSLDTPRWTRRALDSAQLRKKMVAAYLSLCSEIHADVRYAFADMVVQMSDKCIRDYLNFIHEIFSDSQLVLREFISGEIPVMTQDKAIKRASNQKRQSLRETGILAPSEAGRIIDCLARITAFIQSKSPDGSHLDATERGLFVIRLSPSEREMYSSLLDLIKDAAQAGYLMIMEDDLSRWKFRVHTSLAACYFFSYRGAYYETPLNLKDLDEIRICIDKRDFDKKVDKMCSVLAGWREEMPLFEGSDA